MELWVGPVIIAAVVSALVSVAGWFVTFRQSLRMEQRRRDEKVHDFQVALRAEITSDYLNLVVVDRAAHLAEVEERYNQDAGFSIVVPHLASNTIFASIVHDIHILPGAVIAPVVDYARLREVVERFVLDMRGERFSTLSRERQLAMYSDYLKMLDRLEILAENAVAALAASLLTNTPDAAPLNRSSAGGQDAASAEVMGEP